jgi:hypothetical protein
VRENDRYAVHSHHSLIRELCLTGEKWFASGKLEVNSLFLIIMW